MPPAAAAAQAAPSTPVKIVPADFHAVAQHFVDAQGGLEQIRQNFLNALDAASGAAGACDGAHQYQNGWAAAMDSIVNEGFRAAFDLLGSIGKGIDVSALNHVGADQSSVPGNPGGPPRAPLTPQQWPGNTDFAVLTGESPWWMPGFLEKYIPTADTGRLDDAATACRNAGGAVQDLVNGLHAQLQSLVGNNTSDDLTALEQFWQRAAGPQSVLAELPAAMGKLGESLVDFRVWNVDTQQKIKDKIKEVVDDMAVVGVILVIGSIVTDGALDVLIAAVIEGLELFGVDAAGALVAPVAEVVTAAEAILITAGGAIAITQGVVPAMQTAMSSTPNPNIEGADAAKISDELAAHEVPEPNYPKGQLQSHFKHAKDFGVDQNWSNAGAKAYEDALRKFAEDPANSIKTADVGRYRGEPAILIYNENTRVCEVLRPDGTYWTGWKLNVQQLRNVIERGSLGGG